MFLSGFMQEKIIVFEGLDGSGTTTQSKLLKEHFGEKALLTKEPTDSDIGKLIRSCLQKEITIPSLALQMLFTADRAHHLEAELEPALKEGKIVICDRYILSTYAYSIDIDIVKKMNSSFRKPDITFFIDTPPEICMKRIENSRQETELFEQIDKLKKIREQYLEHINDFPNVHIIDGQKDINKINEEIKKILQD